jgi:hypothetical protein
MNIFLRATLGVILLMASSCSTDSRSQPGKWHFTFKEVRAFRLNWEDEQSVARILDRDGNLNPTRIPQDGFVLTNEQITTLEAAVTGDHPNHPIADCLYPHHAFIFYGESGEIVGHIDICFLCTNYSGEPQGYAGNWNLVALRKLFSDMEIPLSNPDWD